MNSQSLPTDQLLLCVHSPLTFSRFFWEQAAAELERRLHIPVALLHWDDEPTTSEPDPVTSIQERWEALWDDLCERGCQRLGVITVGEVDAFQAIIRQSLGWEVAIGVENLKTTVPSIHFAPRWDASDWAELFVDAQQILDRRLPPHQQEAIPCKKVHRSVFGLLVDSPDRIDPVTEDRYSSSSRNARQQRAQVAELIWELRRREIDCDFYFNSENSPLPVCRDQLTVLVDWGRRLDQQCDRSNKRIACGKAKIISSDFKALLPLDKLFGLPHLVSILATKGLLAWEQPALLASRSSPVDLDQMTGAELLDQMRSLLPSHYRINEQSVDPKSMGSARIDSDEFGQVKWGDIWTTFCAFALAGGPPHRGHLLAPPNESHGPVPSHGEETVRYAKVIEELSRGILESTNLETVKSMHRGWLGVRCQTEEMAGWMLLAVVAENVMARREGSVLYVPAGSDFRVRKEIKNVIASVAKAHYYWRQYRSDRLSRQT